MSTQLDQFAGCMNDASPNLSQVKSSVAADLTNEIAALEEALLRVKREHNSHQPIFRLPPEVILLVSKHLKEIWPPRCDRPAYLHPHDNGSREIRRRMNEHELSEVLGFITLKHVCRSLRALLVHCIQLWDEIDFQQLPLEFLLCNLRRSNGHVKKANLNVLSAFLLKTDNFRRTVEDTRGLLLLQKVVDCSSQSLESLKVQTWLSDATPVVTALQTPLPRLRALSVSIQDYSRPAVLLPLDFLQLDRFIALEDLLLHQFALPLNTTLCNGVFNQLRRFEMVTEKNLDSPNDPDVFSSMEDVKTMLENMHRLEELTLCAPIPWLSRGPDYPMRLEESGSMDIYLSSSIRKVSLRAVACNGDIPWLACNLVTPLSATLKIQMDCWDHEPVLTEDAVRDVVRKYTSAQRRPRNMKLAFFPRKWLCVELWLEDEPDRTFWPIPEDDFEPRRDVNLVFGWDDPEEEITPAILIQWVASGICLDDLVEISLCHDFFRSADIDCGAIDECMALLQRATRMKRLRVDWEACGALLASHEQTGSLSAFPLVEVFAIYVEPVIDYAPDVEVAKARLAGLVEYVRMSQSTLRTLKLPKLLCGPEFSSFIRELRGLCSVVMHDGQC